MILYTIENDGLICPVQINSEGTPIVARGNDTVVEHEGEEYKVPTYYACAYRSDTAREAIMDTFEKVGEAQLHAHFIATSQVKEQPCIVGMHSKQRGRFFYASPTTDGYVDLFNADVVPASAEITNRMLLKGMPLSDIVLVEITAEPREATPKPDVREICLYSHKNAATRVMKNMEDETYKIQKSPEMPEGDKKRKWEVVATVKSDVREKAIISYARRLCRAVGDADKEAEKTLVPEAFKDSD